VPHPFRSFIAERMGQHELHWRGAGEEDRL
jgi:hypothetical protein